jgi:hypothetical protein
MSRWVSSVGILGVSVLILLLPGATGASSVEAPHPAHSRGGRPPKEGRRGSLGQVPSYRRHRLG